MLDLLRGLPHQTNAKNINLLELGLLMLNNSRHYQLLIVDSIRQEVDTDEIIAAIAEELTEISASHETLVDFNQEAIRELLSTEIIVGKKIASLFKERVTLSGSAASYKGSGAVTDSGETEDKNEVGLSYKNN